MSEAKKDPALAAFARPTPAEITRNKKARDVRRKAIRHQNASSRMK
jgi:hypothetical protein